MHDYQLRIYLNRDNVYHYHILEGGEKMMKKIIVPICIIGLILVFSGVSVTAKTCENPSDNSMPLNLNECPINITVHEAWELLNDTGNGIQLPIDVRSIEEWDTGYIDTPWPECPIRFEKDLIQTPEGLEEFMELYDGKDIILYSCCGYHSFIVSYILCNAGFTGTIYDMFGGVKGWLEEGYPLRNNTKPDAPTINGPTKAGPDIVLEYNLSTADAEGDAVYYMVDWGDNTTTGWVGPIAINQEFIVNHTYANKGSYMVQAKVKDFYGNESEVTELEINIPRTRTKNFNPLSWLLERFPNLYQIILQILG
jgi:rhodanese-related sulfurtransferase